MGFFPSYKEKPIIPSKHAQNELVKHDLDLWDIVHILNFGYDCSKGRRAPEIVERCIERGSMELRVVVALVEWEDTAFWRLVHVSKNRKTKRE